MKNYHTDLPFRPLSLISHPMAQTILGSFGLPIKGAPSEVLTIKREDGNSFDSKISIPPQWKIGGPIVILTHGMSGSTESRYMVRMSRHLFRCGQMVVRVNHRGIPCGRVKSRILSHGGVTSDLLAMVRQVKENYPGSPITLVGFSVGGNMVLKLLGELGEEALRYIEKAIAVSPPVSLHDSAVRFLRPEMALIQKSFTKELTRLVRAIENEYPELEPVIFPRKMTIIDFDEHYTAPKWGYRNAMEYYEENSSGKYLSDIKLPCRILYSLDDPIVSGEKLDAIHCPDTVERFRTKQGGHLGFLGYTGSLWNFRWMDHTLMEWLVGSPWINC